jgi:hypothetical protein
VAICSGAYVTCTDKVVSGRCRLYKERARRFDRAPISGKQRPPAAGENSEYWRAHATTGDAGSESRAVIRIFFVQGGIAHLFHLAGPALRAGSRTAVLKPLLVSGTIPGNIRHARTCRYRKSRKDAGCARRNRFRRNATPHRYDIQRWSPASRETRCDCSARNPS